MTDTERYPDWLANCVHGYGFGYTKRQALAAMAKNVPGNTGDVDVDIVKHHGDATVNPVSWEVEELLEWTRITIPEQEMNLLRDRAEALEDALIQVEVESIEHDVPGEDDE